MKLSTKGRYGARAALELTIKYGQGPIMVRQIAANQDISERYLEHILNTLRSAGIVKSTRGVKGGYELAKQPHEITLGEIIRALEGPMDIVPCTSCEDCDRSLDCVTIDIWREVKHAIEGVLDNITLDQMLRRHNEKKRDKTLNYVI